MRILVCGGRSYTDVDRAYQALDAIQAARGTIKLVISGGASGADSIAENWARTRRVPLIVRRADWNRYGSYAGPIRNGEMLRDFDPDLVVALPGGVGTNDMISKARAAGVEVMLIDRSAA